MSAADRAAKRAAVDAERARLLAEADTAGLHRALTYVTGWGAVGAGTSAFLTVTVTHRLHWLLWWWLAVTVVCGLLAWRTRRRP